jgi:hypothetical protein
MTPQADQKDATRRSRRQLLAGGTSALAAVLAVEAIARPAPAYAGTDGDVVLGQFNVASTTTAIKTAGGIAFEGAATGPSSTGVYGDAAGTGVAGFSGTGMGVQGTTISGIGVEGMSGSVTVPAPSDVGVFGASHDHWGVAAASITDTALQAQSFGGNGVVGVGTSTGVYGQSGPTNGFALTRDGVRGFTDSSGASGVRGENASGGTGVSGVTSSAGRGAAAVDGANFGSGPGVRGTGGIGVLAAGAIALDVTGPARFSRSGKLTIPAGKASATKTGVSLTGASIVLVTPQNNVAGTAVRSAVPNVAGSSFTVHLAKAVSSAVTIGWFIVN